MLNFWGSSINFNDPLYFWIVIIFLLLFTFLPWLRKKKGLAIDLNYWNTHISFKSNRFFIFSIFSIFISVLLASLLVNPQLITKADSIIVGKPVMLVIDCSGSTLAATDLHPAMTSQEAAQQAFNNLINLRSDISFGLLLFSSQNYIARYFTYKNELFIDTLDDKYAISNMARDTRAAEALTKARLFLTENIKGEDKAIILISDLLFDPEDIWYILKEFERDLLEGIDVYIISTTGEEGHMLWFLNTPGVTTMDIYETASINKMYEELSAMQTSPIRLDESLFKTDLVPFIVLITLSITILCFILSETKFKKIP